MQKQTKPSLSNSWHVLPLAIASYEEHVGAQFIAPEERLLAAMQSGSEGIIQPTLAWSQASHEAIVLGFSQKPDILNPAEMERRPLPVYHRRAGGGAVLAGPHLLAMDVLLPAGHPLILPDVVESYRWLGECWVAALRLLGVETRIVPPAEAHAQRDLLKQADSGTREAILRRACYGALSPYEVVVGQRKVVGLDMVRRRAGTLLQAGLLLSWDTERLAMLLGHTTDEQDILRAGLRERAVGLDELAGRRITAEEAIEAFEQVLGERGYELQRGESRKNVL